jgi:hypothetical protein
MSVTQQAPPIPPIGSWTDRRALQPQTPTPADPEMDKPLQGARGDGDCPVCGSQLAVYRGVPLVLDPKRPGAGPVPETGTARAARQSYWGCGSGKCGLPVPVNHPRQVKLDADWEVVEKKEAEEAARAAKAPPLPNAIPRQLNPVQFLEEEIDKLRAGHEARIAALEREVAALKAALAKKK